MKAEAREIFSQMVRDCGNDIVRMHASFEMYLNQYLVDFPDEKLLLLDAFKVGIPEKIIQHAGEKDYASYLEKLGPRFAAAANRMDDESNWAVETWAIALNRTADYHAPRPPARIYPEELLPVETPELRIITSGSMAIIVMLGGAIGGALATSLLPIAFYAMDLSGHFTGSGQSGAAKTVSSEWAEIIFFVVVALAAAGICGAAALGGWLLGKGAEAPWASFGVACGTACTMVIVVTFTPLPPFIPFLIKPVILFCIVFGTTYKSAARGGNY